MGGRRPSDEPSALLPPGALPESVLVGIPTFQRPTDLTRVLAALAESVEVATAGGLAAQVDILVVDNDPTQTGRVAVETQPLAVTYVVEPTPGVAAVRNRILAEARAHTVLVFIDDDETPEDPSWLHLLLSARRDYAAHVVAGPVRTVVDGGLDPWVESGGFFERSHRTGVRTGDAISRAATNNLLVDLGFVRSTGLRFDDAFGRSGGEDSVFTSELHRAGATMVWCAEAVVIDHLTPDRRTRRHALRRTRTMAATGVRVALALSRRRGDGIVIRLRALCAGVGRAVVGIARIGAAKLVRSSRHGARGWRQFMRGLGGVEGAFGRVHSAYGGHNDHRSETSTDE